MVPGFDISHAREVTGRPDCVRRYPCHPMRRRYRGCGSLFDCSASMKGREGVRISIRAVVLATCELALIVAIGLWQSTVSLAQEADVYHPAGEENPTSGKEDFLNHCAPCHGDNGKGNGPELKVLPDIHPS